MKFDMIIVDGHNLQSCSFLIPHHLSVPYVFMFSYAPELSIGIPVLPSFTGSIFAPIVVPSSMGDKLSVMQDHQTLHYHYSLGGDPELMSEFAPDVNSIWDIILKSELFLITRDHILESAKPSLPNTIFLPGITTKEGEPLPNTCKYY